MTRFMRNVSPGSLPGRTGSFGAGGCKYFFVGIGLAGLGVAVLAVLGVIAYVLLSGQTLAPSAQLQLGVAGPDVAFQEPVPGARLAVGETLLVFAAARDANRVTRVDLWVDDQLAIQQTAPDPNGLTPFSLIHNLVASRPGTYALTVRAYNGLGVMGESARVYVTVIDAPVGLAPPDEAQYVVQPGDTVEEIAKVVGEPPQTIRDMNPGMGDAPNPGDVIVVPAPDTAFPPPVPDPQNAPGLAPEPSSNSAVMILPGLMPNANWKQILDPPHAGINAPVLQKAQAENCAVTLAWTDNSDNETNFAVLRRGKNQLEKTIVQVLKANTTQYQDTVSQPDTYEYTIAAAQAQGVSVNQVAYSNPRLATVLMAPGCQPVAAVAKQVFFRPLKFAGADAARSAIWYGIGDAAIQRLPAGQGEYGVGGGAPIAVPINLKPGEPVILKVRGAAASDSGVADLGGWAISYSPDELARSGGVMKEGKGEIFSLAYELWMEDPAWRAQPAQPTALPTQSAPPTPASPTRLVATFKDLSASKQATGAIRLFANEKSRTSNPMLVGAAPYRLDDVFLSGMMPNNSLNVNVGGNESLQLGFDVSNLCQSDAVIVKPPAGGWGQFDQIFPLQSKDGTCTATVQVKSSGAPLGQLPEPTPDQQAACWFAPPGYRPHVNIVLDGVEKFGGGYVLVISAKSVPGGKECPANLGSLQVRVRVLWGRMLAPSGSGLGGSGGSGGMKQENINDYNLLSRDLGSGYTTAPGVFHRVRIQVGSHGNVGDEPLSVSVTPLNFDDPDLSNNDYNPQFGAGRPDGYPCARSNECLSGSCADDKICAPKNGTGKGGAYCHSNDQCASGLCDCPTGPGVLSPFCLDWQNFSPTYRGTCHVQSENGGKCTQNKDCKSAYCADGKFCAPKNGTGKEGAYCHHDDHCGSGLCECPGGLTKSGNGFCENWQNFTTNTHGTCTAQSKNGESCTRKEECESRNCANGKCAPIDFRGQEGDYCHHDNHCAKSLYCACPFNNSRDSWPWGAFCRGYDNFDPVQFRGTCTKK